MLRLNPFRISLRLGLAVVVVLAVLPLLGLLVVTQRELRQQAILEAQADTARLVRLVVSQHRALIDERLQFLAALAQVQVVRPEHASLCSALFADILRAIPSHANLVAAGPDGRLFCSGLPIAGEVSVADRAYFQLVLRTRRPAVSGFLLSRTTGRAVIALAHPAPDPSGAVRTVLITSIELRWLDEIVAAVKLPRDYVVVFLDHEGRILARHPEPQQWIGKDAAGSDLFRTIQQTRREGTVAAVGVDGVRRMWAFTPLAGPGASDDAYAAVGIREASAYAVADQLRRSGLTWLGLSVCVVLLAWLGMEMLVLRPVQQLVAPVNQLGAGDFSVRVGRVSSIRELQRLGQALDAMAAGVAQLRRNEKMAALGRLAAGVAHELKNPLTVIDGRVQLLRRALDAGRPVTGHVDSLGEATERMKTIMQGLSTYSKPSKPEPTLLDVRQLLAATAGLVAYQARTTEVRVTMDAADDLPAVRGDRSQMTQVLVNLATNAIEAMEGRGGELTLRVAIDGGRVAINVVDTGPGISPERLAKIWDAFYTTKAEGTGLGLSIVRSLVEEQPGGSIDVQSTVGRGTTFTVTMPVASEAAS